MFKYKLIYSSLFFPSAFQSRILSGYCYAHAGCRIGQFIIIIIIIIALQPSVEPWPLFQW
jgi:hypothetical protein